MDRKKIVIISRGIFPLNSPRSNRATELAKEFARQGHDVISYAVLGKYNYAEFEKSFNLKVKNIGRMKFATLNSDGYVRTSLFRALLIRVLRKALEFPDIELSLKVAKLLKNEKDIDLLITIAIPYPIHWGTSYAKKHFVENNIKTWIADCGDPYMGNKFIKHPFYFKYIEKWFCRNADYITVPVKEAIKGYYEEFHDKIKVIPQGFNFDDVILPGKPKVNPITTFIYAGAFYKGVRDPTLFLDYLSELDVDFKFVVFTKNVPLVSKYKSKLGNKLDLRDFISRKELLIEMQQADFLVNFENNTEVQSPSKLIDYALSNRPILSIPSMDINKKQVLNFIKGDYTGQLIVQNIDQYNIKNVVDKFIKLMKK